MPHHCQCVCTRVHVCMCVSYCSRPLNLEDPIMGEPLGIISYNLNNIIRNFMENVDKGNLNKLRCIVTVSLQIPMKHFHHSD